MHSAQKDNGSFVITSFFKLNILNVPADLEEVISSLCFEFGAMGVSETLDFDKKVYPEPKIIEKSHKTLEAYFEAAPELLLKNIAEKFPSIEVLLEEQENKDWMEEWKKGFHAFQLVDRFWIVPSWEKIENFNIDPIFIDPGMAFGTGTHETTQICSALLFKVLSANKIKSLIDVGTGTGILAFVASKMGIQEIWGTDNDPEAIRVAQENADINKISLKLTHKDLPQIDKKFDVVVANIIDGVLLKLKPALLNKLNSPGFIILSGILDENDAEFIKEFLFESGLKIMRRQEKGEWVGYLLTNS